MHAKVDLRGLGAIAVEVEHQRVVRRIPVQALGEDLQRLQLGHQKTPDRVPDRNLVALAVDPEGHAQVTQAADLVLVVGLTKSEVVDDHRGGQQVITSQAFGVAPADDQLARIAVAVAHKGQQPVDDEVGFAVLRAPAAGERDAEHLQPVILFGVHDEGAGRPPENIVTTPRAVECVAPELALVAPVEDEVAARPADGDATGAVDDHDPVFTLAAIELEAQVGRRGRAVGVVGIELLAREDIARVAHDEQVVAGAALDLAEVGEIVARWPAGSKTNELVDIAVPEHVVAGGELDFLGTRHAQRVVAREAREDRRRRGGHADRRADEVDQQRQVADILQAAVVAVTGARGAVDGDDRLGRAGVRDAVEIGLADGAALRSDPHVDPDRPLQHVGGDDDLVSTLRQDHLLDLDQRVGARQAGVFVPDREQRCFVVTEHAGRDRGDGHALGGGGVGVVVVGDRIFDDIVVGPVGRQVGQEVDQVLDRVAFELVADIDVVVVARGAVLVGRAEMVEELVAAEAGKHEVAPGAGDDDVVAITGGDEIVAFCAGDFFVFVVAHVDIDIGVVAGAGGHVVGPFGEVDLGDGGELANVDAIQRDAPVAGAPAPIDEFVQRFVVDRGADIQRLPEQRFEVLVQLSRLAEVVVHQHRLVGHVQPLAAVADAGAQHVAQEDVGEVDREGLAVFGAADKAFFDAHVADRVALDRMQRQRAGVLGRDARQHGRHRGRELDRVGAELDLEIEPLDIEKRVMAGVGVDLADIVKIVEQHPDAGVAKGLVAAIER